jgi:hypothetical protein
VQRLVNYDSSSDEEPPAKRVRLEPNNSIVSPRLVKEPSTPHKKRQISRRLSYDFTH